jgi:tetratricopeptide (TPR) repeat protein
MRILLKALTFGLLMGFVASVNARILPFDSAPEPIMQAAKLARLGQLGDAERQLLLYQDLHPSEAASSAGWGALHLFRGRRNNALDRFNEAFSYQLSRVVLSSTRIRAFRKTGVRAGFFKGPFDSADFNYLQRCLVYNNLAHSLTRDATTPLQSLERLNNWVYRNIDDNVIAASPTADFGANPYDIMLRGYGACDRMAWVYCALARQLGYHSYIVYLRPAGGGASRHTLATTWTGTQWILADSQNGLILRDDKVNPLSIPKIAKNPKLLGHYSCYYESGLDKDFRFCNLMWSEEVESYRPRMEILQEWFDMLGFKMAIYSPPMQPQLPSAPWAWAFKVQSRSASSSDYQMLRAQVMGDIEGIRKGRLLYMNGRFGDAAEQYEQFTSKKRTASDEQANARYFLGLSWFEAGQDSRARRALQSYLKRKKGVWHVKANLHLAMLEERAGKRRKALKYYRQCQHDSELVRLKIAELEQSGKKKR